MKFFIFDIVMKQILAFSILFCLVFLNVPKNFIHDCSHHEIKYSHNDNDHQLSIDVDVDACFICEFDLGVFSIPKFKGLAFAEFFNYIFIKPSVDYVNPDAFFAFSHRGPPIA